METEGQGSAKRACAWKFQSPLCPSYRHFAFAKWGQESRILLTPKLGNLPHWNILKFLPGLTKFLLLVQKPTSSNPEFSKPLGSADLRVSANPLNSATATAVDKMEMNRHGYVPAKPFTDTDWNFR